MRRNIGLSHKQTLVLREGQLGRPLSVRTRFGDPEAPGLLRFMISRHSMGAMPLADIFSSLCSISPSLRPSFGSPFVFLLPALLLERTVREIKHEMGFTKGAFDPPIHTTNRCNQVFAVIRLRKLEPRVKKQIMPLVFMTCINLHTSCVNHFLYFSGMENYGRAFY